MSKKFKDVKVEYESCYFDIEIDDKEIQFAKDCGIDIEDDVFHHKIADKTGKE